MEGDIETYFDEGSWRNRVLGSDRASSRHNARGEAALVGRQMARYRGVEHILRNTDGTVASRSNFRLETPAVEAGRWDEAGSTAD